MTPRTERGAVEKIYRVRMYLISAAGDRSLTFEQVMGMNKAERMLVKIQQMFW